MRVSCGNIFEKFAGLKNKKLQKIPPRWAVFWLVLLAGLAGEFFVEIRVIVEFFWLEPESDFFLGLFFVAAGVDEVWHTHALGVGIAEAHVGVVATNSAHFGGFWFGWANDFADERDAFDAFKNHSDDWASHHVAQVVAERLLAAASDHLANVFVVGAVLVFVRHDHFHANDFKADALEALEDFTDDTALNGVWLQNDQAALN